MFERCGKKDVGLCRASSFKASMVLNGESTSFSRNKGICSSTKFSPRTEPPICMSLPSDREAPLRMLVSCV